MGVIDPSNKEEELAKSYWVIRSEVDRKAHRLQRKKDFVREAYMARCRTVDHMNHVEVAKMCAEAFDFIESIND